MLREPGKSPMAARLVLDDGSGIDITEAGSKKSLAISLVRRADEVWGVARMGPEPLDASFTEDVFRGILTAKGRAHIKGVLRNQATIAGIGNAYSDEILHAAKMSPFKSANMKPDDAARLYAALQSTLRSAVERADGVSACELKGEKKSNLQLHGRTPGCRARCAATPCGR